MLRKATVVAAAAAVVAWIGCSSDPSPTSSMVVADAGSGPVRVPPQPDPGFDSGPTCADDCKARHPVGAPLDDAVDRCWAASCAAACITFTATTAADAGADAGDAGDAGDPDPPSCGAVLVATPTDACNACTVASCCDAWAACFSSQDCTDLNACLQLCP